MKSHLYNSIIANNTEKGDIATEEDLYELIFLLFRESECYFYYFNEKGTKLHQINLYLKLKNVVTF